MFHPSLSRIRIIQKKNNRYILSYSLWVKGNGNQCTAKNHLSIEHTPNYLKFLRTPDYKYDTRNRYWRQYQYWIYYWWYYQFEFVSFPFCHFFHWIFYSEVTLRCEIQTVFFITNKKRIFENYFSKKSNSSTWYVDNGRNKACIFLFLKLIYLHALFRNISAFYRCAVTRMENNSDPYRKANALIHPKMFIQCSMKISC